MSIHADREAVMSGEIDRFARGQGIVGRDGEPLIAWRGRNFDPILVPGAGLETDGEHENMYLRPDAFGAPPVSVSVDRGESMYRWTQQVSICIRKGVDETPALRVADALTAVFWRPRRLQGLHTYVVERTPHLAGSIDEPEEWLSFPVSIRLHAFA